MKNILIPILFLATLIHTLGDHGQPPNQFHSDDPPKKFLSEYRHPFRSDDPANKFLSEYRRDLIKSDPMNLHLRMTDFELFMDLCRIMEEKNAWDYYEQAYPGLKSSYWKQQMKATFRSPEARAMIQNALTPYHEPDQTQEADKNSFGGWVWIIIGGLAGTVLARGILSIIINQSMKSTGAKSQGDS